LNNAKLTSSGRIVKNSIKASILSGGLVNLNAKNNNQILFVLFSWMD
jgi:hypothetical protein